MKYCSFLALACLTSAACADTFPGIFTGAGSWQNDLSGTLDAGTSVIDVEDDLRFEADRANTFYVALEHQIPGLPNVMANYSSLSAEGANRLHRSFDIKGIGFNVADDIATSLDLVQHDVVMYYELLNNWLSVDAGLAVRWLDGEINTTSSSAYASTRLDAPVPLFYGKARFDLPTSGLWVAADGMGMSYDGNRILDLRAVIGWDSQIGVGVEAGWRRYALTLEEFDQVDYADIEFEGPFAAFTYRF